MSEGGFFIIRWWSSEVDNVIGLIFVSLIFVQYPVTTFPGFLLTLHVPLTIRARKWLIPETSIFIISDFINF